MWSFRERENQRYSYDGEKEKRQYLLKTELKKENKPWTGRETRSGPLTHTNTHVTLLTRVTPSSLGWLRLPPVATSCLTSDIIVLGLCVFMVCMDDTSTPKKHKHDSDMLQ